MAGLGNLWVSLLFLSLRLALNWSVQSVELGPKEAAHSVLNAHGICGTFVWSKGYDCAEFMVPTKDGFLLSVQRMSSPIFRTVDKEPTFLYHGIMQGGEAWVLNEPRESLAFIIADSGYDVWIGNTRTTMFSYGHTIYNRTQKEFWDWNADDLVAYDLPEMLEFVSDATGKQILYVGYSEGAMAAFAGFTNSEMANLVKKAGMLSPVAYLNHVTSPLIQAAAWLYIDRVELSDGDYEFSLSGVQGSATIQSLCRRTRSNCMDLSSLVTGPSCCTNKSMTAYYNKYQQSTSTKNLAQMAQLLRSGRFGKYDYGLVGNLANYLTLTPPSYDLSAIPRHLPFFLAHGGRDMLADEEDVRHLAELLPGYVKILKMPNYNHGDFILGTSAHSDVYPHLLEFFREP